MTNNSVQNGRQSTPHQRAAPPADHRTKNSAASNSQICRNFIWGICTMGPQCKYRHELDYETMRTVLKFCHQYQNKGRCEWAGCTYLHTSQEEETLFLTTGQIPRVLAERYATMSLLQPPPPPPPPPSTIASTNTQLATNHPPAEHSSAQEIRSVPVAMPALPERFDPSRPPPSAEQTLTRLKKRRSDSDEAATSSKVKKMDGSNNLCENCIQHKLRIEIYQEEIEKKQQEEQNQRLILNKKKKNLENGKLLLRSILTPKWFTVLDNYIEGGTQPTNILSQHSTSFNSETSIMPRQFLLQLLKCVLIGNESIPSPQEALFQSLTGLSRRNNAPAPTTSSDALQMLLESLRNTAAERPSPPSAVAGTSARDVAAHAQYAPPAPVPAPAPHAPPAPPSYGLAYPPAAPYYAAQLPGPSGASPHYPPAPAAPAASPYSGSYAHYYALPPTPAPPPPYR